VIVEQAAQGRLVERIALTKTFKPADVYGQRIVLQHEAVDWDPQVDWRNTAATMQRLPESVLSLREWVPVLKIEKTEARENAFSSAGRIRTAPASGDGRTSARPGADALAGGLFGGLSGGEATPDDEQKTNAQDDGTNQLTAEWIEYEVHSPGVKTRVERREVFDLLGPSARAAGAPLRIANTRTERLERALALLGTTTILPLASRLSPEFVASQTARALLANREILLALMRRSAKDAGADLSPQLAKLTPLPGALANLALARDSWNTFAGDSYLASPNILSQRSGLRVDGSGEIVSFDAFDIVVNDVAPRPGLARDAFDVRLRQGTVDSNAEMFLMAGASGTGAAAEAFARPDATGSSWTLVRTTADVGRLHVPEDARARILRDVKAGNVAVVPADTAAAEFAWWRVDPVTGRTLGMGNRGWGQSTSEILVSHARIALRTFSIIMCLKQVEKKSETSPTGAGLWLSLCVVGGSGAMTNLLVSAPSAGLPALAALVGDIAGALGFAVNYAYF